MNPPKSSHIPPLMKADTAVISFAAEKDGKIRVVYAGWDEVKVVLPGQVFEVRWARRGSLLICTKSPFTPQWCGYLCTLHAFPQTNAPFDSAISGESASHCACKMEWTIRCATSALTCESG
jgi:hypothetical protein